MIEIGPELASVLKTVGACFAIAAIYWAMFR